MKQLLVVVTLALVFVSASAQQGGMGPGPGAQTYSGGGGPFASDTYTESSDVTYASHTPEAGGPITLHSSYSGAATVDATLDRLYLTSASAAAYYFTTTSPGATPCVQVDFRRLSQMSANASIALDMSTGADTMLLLRLNDPGVGNIGWEVIDRVAGSSTFLASVNGTHVPAVGGAAVNVKMCRNGNAITVFFDGVQDTGLNATTTITATGRVGIRLSGTASSTTGIHLDNFSAQ